MATKKKRLPLTPALPDSGEATVSSPAVAHDPALHEAAGRPNGAVRGCLACDDNVASGIAAYARPGDRGGMVMAMQKELRESIPPATVEILPGQDDVLAAVLAAAERLSPGLAETLAPVVQYGLEQMAVQGAEDQAFKVWQASVEKRLAEIQDDVRKGIGAVHANVVELIRRLFDDKGRSRIQEVK